ncbi:hypothetical protein HMPREF0004_0173 [Achromobacter piechaudii ATCC 43553]|uniref:Uncharacterized protein n=1 Tax=Achromobacter piechaudii ATCC 43553 TaxID=742159 RepID=D4X3X6_9BURK|nr:hypothetical protein HMPREF0004_0173 [Achromobacter piechaudii ATCC 43553]
MNVNKFSWRHGGARQWRAFAQQARFSPEGPSGNHDSATA